MNFIITIMQSLSDAHFTKLSLAIRIYSLISLHQKLYTLVECCFAKQNNKRAGGGEFRVTETYIRN